MRTVSEELFPAKFLCLIGHIAMVLVVYFAEDDNVFAGIPYSAAKGDEEYEKGRDSLVAALSLSLILLLVELAVLLIGVTLQHPGVTIVSILFHALGIVFMVWFFLLSWRYQVVWAIWVFSCIVPFTLEVLVLIMFKINLPLKN